MTMTRRIALSFALVAWMQGSGLAFQQAPRNQRYGQIIGGRRDTTSLFVQSTEPPTNLEQGNEDKDESDTPGVPHFAQDEGIKEPRPEVEKELEDQALGYSSLTSSSTTTPENPPPPSAVDLQMGEKETSASEEPPVVNPTPRTKATLVTDTTFDDAVAKPAKPTAPTTPPPPSMFAPKDDEGPSATSEFLEAVRDATVAVTMELLVSSWNGHALMFVCVCFFAT